ncbi:unnamed protein product [Closterium sp. Yama58-4]|nr:unnamed protein product [Closterium sp. Yama58-4]
MARQVSRDRRASDKDEKEGAASGSDSKRRQRADAGRRYEAETPSLGKIAVAFLLTALVAALCAVVVYFTQDRMVNAVASERQSAVSHLCHRIISAIAPSLPSHHLCHRTISAIAPSLPSHHLCHRTISAVAPSLPSHHLCRRTISAVAPSPPSHRLRHRIVSAIASSLLSLPSHHRSRRITPPYSASFLPALATVVRPFVQHLLLLLHLPFASAVLTVIMWWPNVDDLLNSCWSLLLEAMLVVALRFR